MDIAPSLAERSRGERVARTAVVTFVALALLTLVFGLGWAAKDATGSGTSSGGGASKGHTKSDGDDDDEDRCVIVSHDGACKHGNHK